jgi:hypothetical protein
MKLKCYSYQTQNLLFECEQTELMNQIVKNMGLGNYTPCQLLPNPKFLSLHYVIDKDGAVLAALNIYELIPKYVIKHIITGQYLMRDENTCALTWVDKPNFKFLNHKLAIALAEFLDSVAIDTIHEEIEYIHE